MQKKEKERSDNQEENKKIAERLLKFNQQSHKEKDGGGSKKPN